MNASTMEHLNSVAQTDPAIVREGFVTQRAAGLRAKDAAEALGLSEGAVVQAHTGAHDQPLQATPLVDGQWLAVLQALEACGPVMALTRNETVVHEKDGIYRNLTQEGPIGLCVNPDIDLRLFFMHWHAGYAVTEPGRGGARAHSLQFFDGAGVAVHKVYARPATDLAAWRALVARFADAGAQHRFQPRAVQSAVAPDSSIDAAGLRSAWAAMQDTHAFFGMLKKFGCERQQSFRLTQGQFCAPLATGVVTALLQRAAAASTPIMVFAGSKGCIQIHSGPVNNIKPLATPGAAQWINVLDAGFNLHLRTDRVVSAWLVRKPTVDGVVTSVEVFDDSGEVVAMFFGVRKPGQPELAAWRDLAETLERL
ncbi:MAG: ChuX/HutX family heme-like substrate-binding protein [Comamonas sp.]